MKSKKRKSIKSSIEDANGIRISYHEKVCAERMKTLFKAIDEMKKDIKIIGLCYDFQCLEYLELQPHDVLCDMVVTEQNIYEVI